MANFIVYGSLFLTIGLGSAQTVRVTSHVGSGDAWGANFNANHKITFSGRVTGIQKTKPGSSTETEVTLLVRNKVGGGTAVVDLGPSWFVDHQTARIRVGDKVQVTGSKTMVDGRGIILASMIVQGGRGGLVLALRRPSGKAYWVGTESVGSNGIPTGANTITGKVSSLGTFMYNNVPYASAVLQTSNGTTTIDLGPQWYYGQQNVRYQVGNNLTVVVGPNPITVNPGLTILPSYTIFDGPSTYTLRLPNGNPVYYWGP